MSDQPKKTYGLLIPPPNLTGELHLGHAMQHSILDAVARFKRLQGFDVLLQPGVDHAGIQFEGTFNKKLSKDGINKNDLTREEWLEKAESFKEEIYQSLHNTWKVMGLSANWEKEVYSLEPKVQKAVFHQFNSFWEDDLLYKGAYIVKWCPKCNTAIEEVEMEYEEKTEKLYFVKYQVIPSEAEESGSLHVGRDDIVIATARPETIYADSGIAIYPNHPLFSKFIGLKAVNPLNGNLLPIFEDPRVDKEFGTGALKITPGHDPLDYQIGKDQGLPILHVINKLGRMTELAGELQGLKIAEAREKVVELLGDAIEKTQEYTHSVPVCERCKTTVEPLISEEWFVKMDPLAQKALKKIDEVNFIPSNYNKILTDWISNIHDWCISRNLWWGHRIPVWYCQKCNPNHLVGKDKDMVISEEEPGKSCQSCSEKHWVQDPQILDTWFSSGLWPLATLGWPEKTPDLERYFPWDFELTSPEIKFLWITRMIMLSVWHTDSIPFKNMFFHGTIRGMDGKKMSKSLGNGVDPLELINQWGTDPTRMTLYSFSAPGRDARLNRQIADERAKSFRNFATKIKNIHRFIYELKPEDALAKTEFTDDQDVEIIQQLNGVIDKVTKNIESFQLHLATEELYDFIWNKFASSYIESTKSRRAEAQKTLEEVFEKSLIMLYPFMPFLVEELLPEINNKSWPQG